VFSDGEDGSLIVELQVGLSPELVSWIFSWNQYAEVLGPPELKEMMAEKVNLLKKIYSAT